MEEGQIEELKNYLDRSKRAVAVTGAGISFSSDGLDYATLTTKEYKEMISLESERTLRNDPKGYYRILDRLYLHSMFDVGPSAAHRALARLESEGKLSGIITTNIDCLHTMAGSEHVAELQGSLRINCCVDCGRRVDDYLIWSHKEIPVCPDCGGFVWSFPFYSSGNVDNDGARLARRLISRASLILLVGTNGAYSPTYWTLRKRKARVVVINPGETRFDQGADLLIRSGADEAFTELLGLYDAQGS